MVDIRQLRNHDQPSPKMTSKDEEIAMLFDILQNRVTVDVDADHIIVTLPLEYPRQFVLLLPLLVCSH